MKRFNELTKDQQDQAMNYALEELTGCIMRGLVHFEKPVDRSTLKEYALAAAETAWYSEREDKIISGIVED